MGSTSPAILLGLFLISAHLLAHLAAQPAPGAFKCSHTKATCQGLVDYKVPNATALSVIKTRFGVENLNALLGANNYPTSTPPSRVVAANQTIKIPFPCACVNGTGVSDGVPVYAVKDGDGLDRIARDVFAALVTFQQIAAASGIPDPNVIAVGQKLNIPLPCSCEPVNGTQVVHYGHVVQPGSTVEEIAQRFGTTNVTLLELNGMANASGLLAGQVLDVPLRACSSSVRNDSLDSPLLVPNGTYALTAHDCVKCNCDSTKSWNLQCEASQLNSTNSNWPVCPSTQCKDSSLFFGNTTTPPSDATCNVTACSYAGYNNQTIFTSLHSDSTCSATNPKNDASKMGPEAWSWNFIFISTHFVLLCVGLFL